MILTLESLEMSVRFALFCYISQLPRGLESKGNAVSLHVIPRKM